MMLVSVPVMNVKGAFPIMMGLLVRSLPLDAVRWLVVVVVLVAAVTMFRALRLSAGRS